MKKIAILSRYQKTIARGAESFVFELSQQLSKEHQVDILDGKDSDDFQKMINGKFDILIPMNGRTQMLKASLARLFCQTKVVVIGESGVGRDTFFNLLMWPDKFVALTDFMLEWAQTKTGWVKMVKIGNGVDIETFKPTGPKFKTRLKGPVLISVGALEEYKGHQHLINALALLPDVSLLVVGKGGYQRELIKLAEEKIPGRFQIESAPYKELPSYYRAADLFALASWSHEAFGIVYVEALASGLPAIGPDDLSRREIIGSGGITVDVTNPQKLADTIKKVLETKWGDKPRKQGEKFSWQVIGQKYLELVKELR